MLQAIIWNNANVFHRRIYASSGLNDLNFKTAQTFRFNIYYLITAKLLLESSQGISCKELNHDHKFPFISHGAPFLGLKAHRKQ